MIIVIKKCAKIGVIYSDITGASEYFGVHRDTLTDRLPYWEDSDHIVCETYEFVKSKRGRKKQDGKESQ